MEKIKEFYKILKSVISIAYYTAKYKQGNGLTLRDKNIDKDLFNVLVTLKRVKYINCTFNDFTVLDKTVNGVFESCTFLYGNLYDCTLKCRFQNTNVKNCSISHCTVGKLNVKACEITNNNLYLKLNKETELYLASSDIFNNRVDLKQTVPCVNVGFVVDCHFVENTFDIAWKTADNDGSPISITRCPSLSNVCPEKGSFIGYKRVADTDEPDIEYIATLEIPEDAERSSANCRKCRCSHAKVLCLEFLSGDPLPIHTTGKPLMVTNRHVTYKVGEMVKAHDFDKNRFRTCAPGIHFFMTKQEAIDY